MKKICITGANGFIGSSLCKRLSSSSNLVRGLVRNFESKLHVNNINYVSIGNISSNKCLENYLLGYDTLVHCAGKAHVMNKKKNLNLYRLINTEGTKYFAEQAVKSGIKRFIFLSTTKVYGEGFVNRDKAKILTLNDLPDPQDCYSVSKFEAENILWDIASRTNLEVVVIRLPLVYGYGVKGNLKLLMKLINSGIPLPFSLVKNKRSLIGIDNLIDLIINCIEHPEAGGKTFLASDNEDLSTPDLLKYIASAMGRPLRLFPLPVSLLKFLGRIFRKKTEIDRLIGSFQVDSNYTRKILNYSTKLSAQKGIRKMVQG